MSVPCPGVVGCPLAFPGVSVPAYLHLLQAPHTHFCDGVCRNGVEGRSSASPVCCSGECGVLPFQGMCVPVATRGLARSQVRGLVWRVALRYFQCMHCIVGVYVPRAAQSQCPTEPEPHRHRCTCFGKGKGAGAVVFFLFCLLHVAHRIFRQGRPCVCVVNQGLLCTDAGADCSEWQGVPRRTIG